MKGIHKNRIQCVCANTQESVSRAIELHPCVRVSRKEGSRHFLFFSTWHISQVCTLVI